MTISEIIIIFIIFSVVWILTQMLWKIIEGKLLLKQQEKMMDMAYSKVVKLILRFKLEMRGMKDGSN